LFKFNEGVITAITSGSIAVNRLGPVSCELVFIPERNIGKVLQEFPLKKAIQR
jgi:hypothetical protein